MAVTFALCEKEIYKRFNEFGIFAPPTITIVIQAVQICKYNNHTKYQYLRNFANMNSLNTL